MSSITTIRDKNGRAIKYRARYRTPEGASRSQTFTNRDAAKKFLANMEVRKASGDYVDAAAGRLTFGHYAEQWVSSQPHRATTAASVRSILDQHILPTFGERPIASIRPSHVQAWVSGLKLAPSTVTVVYGKLVAVFRAAVDDRVITSSPCTRSIRLPRSTGAEVAPMRPEEVRAVVDAMPARYRALLVLIAGSGMRPGEACGLTVDRVDWLRRTIRVDRQLVTMSASEAFLAPCKTPSSVRTIPVPASVVDALSAHLAQFPAGAEGVLFTDSDGCAVRRHVLGSAWRRAAVKSGVVDRTPHDLRHYAASVMIHEGASVKAVQRQLGHASASTTLNVYAHLWPEADDVSRRALDAGIAQLVSPACHAATAASDA